MTGFYLFIKERRAGIVRFIKFSIVGGSGVVVNWGGLFLLASLFNLPKVLSKAIAIEASILNNFFWNNLWTWRERRGEPFYIRLIKYNLATISTSALGDFLTFFVLYRLGIHYLIAGAAGIGVAVLINFLLADKWVFKP
jgi:dolichol-phosphate mannosyltransferase